MIPGLTPSCGNRLTTLPSLLFSVGATVTTTEKKTENVGSNFSSPEQEHRRKVFNELNSLISGDSVSDESSAVDEEVNDTEWFFLVSMAQSFVNDDVLDKLILTQLRCGWSAMRILSSPGARGQDKVKNTVYRR